VSEGRIDGVRTAALAVDGAVGAAAVNGHVDVPVTGCVVGDLERLAGVADEIVRHWVSTYARHDIDHVGRVRHVEHGKVASDTCRPSADAAVGTRLRCHLNQA
jgi:hypothetical protein